MAQDEIRMTNDQRARRLNGENAGRREGRSTAGWSFVMLTA
jgi:hypothetical protein